MIMSWNKSAGRKVQVDGEELEVASKFVYLGGTVAQEGGSDEDSNSRLGKARSAFSKLRNIWKSGQLKLKTTHRPRPQNGFKQTSQDSTNVGPRGKKKSWKTKRDLA